MAINSFSGPAAPGKPCRKQSNGAGNRILNLMPSMTTFRKSSNSMDTTAGRFPVITIRNGAMPLCLFCNIQFYFCCLGKFFFSVQQFIFLLFRQAVENFLVTKKETVNTLSCTNRHQQSFCYLSSFFDFSIFTFFFSCGICFASFIFSLTDGFSSFFCCLLLQILFR